jgi:thioredoxin-like negative regulator of GroEL
MFEYFNENTSHEQVKNAGRIGLAYFWGRWSQECRSMYPLIQSASNFIGREDALVQINWDRQKQLACEMDVFGVPTLLVYFNGRESARYSGTMNNDLLKRIEESKKRFFRG